MSKRQIQRTDAGQDGRIRLVTTSSQARIGNILLLLPCSADHEQHWSLVYSSTPGYKSCFAGSADYTVACVILCL